MKPRQKSEAISQNIPLEILGYIFTIICADDVCLPPEADQYPWILGHICSYWRWVLWNTHSIWRKIVTTYPDMTRRTPKRSSRMARRRAVTEMLIFILEKTDSPISLAVHESVEFYLNIIVEQPERFSSLFLFDVSETAVLRLLDLPPNAFPILVHFTFAAPSAGRLIFERATSPFLTAPKLRSIKYNDNLKYSTEPQINLHIPFTTPLAWSKLEEITIRAFALSFTEIYDIWKSTPSLRFCNFEIKDSGGIPTMQEVILSTLQSLYLTTFSILDWDGILRPIMAPALENLYIDALNVPIYPLLFLMSRSRCFLKMLDVCEESPAEEEITGSVACDLFHHTAAATTLAVSWTFSTSTIQSISDGALPNLVKADFCVSPEAFSALLDMIDLYIDQSRTLPCFTIICHPGPGLNEVRVRYLARYRLYKVRGVEITVTDGETFEELEVREPDSDDSDSATDEEDYDDEL